MKIGTPVEELETPVALIDLDALEHNIGVIATHYRDKRIRLRPHGKNHKSPQILAMQIAAGGTVGGVCAAKVSEAEVFVNNGARNVLVANQVVDADKVRRLAALAKRVPTTVAIDDEAQIEPLAAGARALGAMLGVVIEIDTMMGRGGVRSIEQAVKLARVTTATPLWHFRRRHEPQVPPNDHRTARSVSTKAAATSNTWSPPNAPSRLPPSPWRSCPRANPGPTTSPRRFRTSPRSRAAHTFMEVPYAFMDEFRYALRIMGRVVARPDARTAVGDVPSTHRGTERVSDRRWDRRRVGHSHRPPWCHAVVETTFPLGCRRTRSPPSRTSRT